MVITATLQSLSRLIGNLRKALAIALIIVCCLSIARAQQPPVVESNNTSGGSVFLKTIKCYCHDHYLHGAVHIVQADGSDQIVSKSNAIDPRVADDGQTIGWLVGRHINVDDPEAARSPKDNYFPTKVVVYQNGQILVRFRSLCKNTFVMHNYHNCTTYPLKVLITDSIGICIQNFKNKVVKILYLLQLN